MGWKLRLVAENLGLRLRLGQRELGTEVSRSEAGSVEAGLEEAGLTR